MEQPNKAAIKITVAFRGSEIVTANYGMQIFSQILRAYALSSIQAA